MGVDRCIPYMYDTNRVYVRIPKYANAEVLK